MNPSPAHATTVVLAGNPNSGKTVLFNALTGARQKVGNWPGVTVDQKKGYCVHSNQRIDVVDLPGTYSISVSAEESAIDERIACRYLLSGQADIIVNVIDGSHLERHLYLTLQLLEMRIPMIIAVNMMDVVEKKGMSLDLTTLSQQLGCPVVGLVANRKQGITDLKTAILQLSAQPKPASFQLPLPAFLETPIHTLSNALDIETHQDRHWFAQRLLEEDQFAQEHVPPSIRALADTQRQAIEASEGESPDIFIADARYTAIDQMILSTLSLKKTKSHNRTERIDRIVLNRFLGIPIFLLMMYIMFVFSINIGGAFQDFFDITSNTLFVNALSHLLLFWHVPAWLTAMIANGIGKGINTVITFIPIIGAMFLFLSFLEDCGYMARAAFVMDRCMQKLGLPGKSFVPMIVGFGCNVPAVMGARTLANPRDRILTVMMMPFMSCGARLAIFAVFASAFFPVGGEDIIFLLYLTGIVAAILTGLLLRKTVLPGKPAPLVLELPPYHLPRLNTLCRHMWQRLKRFLIRAGKVIIPVCMIVGFLNSVTVTGALSANENGNTQSLLSQAGRLVTPALAPMGIQQNNWPATVGLLTGVLAKEVVVGTLNTLYTQQMHAAQTGLKPINIWHNLRDAVFSIPENLANLGQAFKNPLLANEAAHSMDKNVYGIMGQRFNGQVGAFAYLLFILLYFPCVSTMAATRRELNRRWACFSVIWSTSVAYAAAVVVYQLFTLFDHPVTSFLWVAIMLSYIMGIISMMRQTAVRKNDLIST